MPKQEERLPALNWTKQRIDEMDATLASLKAKAKSKANRVSAGKADQLVADLKKRRDEFQARAKVAAQAGKATLQTAKAQLEPQWDAFEAQVKTYFKTAGRQVEQQQATFKAAANAQAKAWREAANKLRAEAAKAAPVRRADIHGVLEKMKADAVVAEARLQQLRQAGSKSWSALGGALAKSRRAFDRANQAASNALKRATPSKS